MSSKNAVLSDPVRTSYYTYWRYYQQICHNSQRLRNLQGCASNIDEIGFGANVDVDLYTEIYWNQSDNPTDISPYTKFQVRHVLGD